MIGASVLAGCTPKPNNPQNPTPSTGPDITSRDTLSFVFEGLYPKGEVKDAENGFAKVSDIKSAKVFVNGEYKSSFTELGSRQDIKLELTGKSATRLVQVASGTAFTLPATGVTADYSLSLYRTQYLFGDSVLTYSAEHSNPYTQSNGWYIYVNEWLIRHLINPVYYTNQNLTLLKPLDFPVNYVGSDGTSDGLRTYPTAPTGNLTRREGYEIYRFDILINDGEKVERPYYNIGVVHAVGDSRNFGLFVMKSKTDQSEVMDALVQSWTKFDAKGIQRSYFKPGAPVENPNWNEETKAYFNQLMTEDKKNWGVFSYSMPGEEDSLVPNSGNYNEFLTKSKAMQEYIESDKVWGRKYDIYMTYTHLGWGPRGSTKFNTHYFPLAMAKELAGGNGDGTKPTLEFTFQFTTNNNLVDDELSPMFDILRGKFDDYFKRLALDIKAYGAPLMLRLNNEMNTDWTSYSGIMNLLDPDIFVMTWRRMYDIFEENGVDNVMWIWNPIAKSCPYSSWSEDLCYFPGVNYTQLLGGTSYEMNNYKDNAEKLITSFARHYGELYNKNKDYFADWGMIIGEFACGSGGNAGESEGMALGRNAAAQATWVEGMLNELYSDKPAPYAKQIKGLIWFNCNDEIGENLITNRLRFAEPSGGYDDLAATHLAFFNGFKKANGR